MAKVLVWSDHDGLTAELRSKGAALGDLLVADGGGLPDQDPATIAVALAAAAKEHGVGLLLVGASKRGKDVGPRAAALLDWPFAGEAHSVEADGDGWKASRMVLSGNSLATYDMGAHAVCTATPGTFEAADAADGTLVKLAADKPSPVKVTGTAGEEAGDFDLGAADYVVGVGRGFKAKADIALAEALAKALPGGAVGCSRPVAADLKWLGEEHWIGLSGHEIKPKVYFACGVSGQIQHVAGIRGSKLIVAINTNKDAPIFQVADYGIVGDLYKVLPKLTEVLAKK